MAIYQFVIELIPRAWVENNRDDSTDMLFNNDLYDLSPAWKEIQLSKDAEELISQILPKKQSWHKNLKLWGNDEQNDIHVWLECGHVESIKVRLDLRSNITSLKLQIIDFAKRYDYQFFLPELKEIIVPDLDLLNQKILSSKATHFVSDPEKFFT